MEAHVTIEASTSGIGMVCFVDVIRRDGDEFMYESVDKILVGDLQLAMGAAYFRLTESGYTVIGPPVYFDGAIKIPIREME